MSSETVSNIKSTVNDNWIIGVIVAVFVIVAIVLIIIIKNKKKNKKVEEETPIIHTTIPIEQTYVAAEAVNIPETETPPITEDIATTESITEPNINDQTNLVSSVPEEQPVEPITDNSYNPLEATASITEMPTETSPEVPVLSTYEEPQIKINETSYSTVENDLNSPTESQDTEVVSTIEPDNSEM